ncbi:MAG: TonB-dependent receptor [Alistipes sp.]|nr:TonB-dependent receptor [Alistipes sp.]
MRHILYTLALCLFAQTAVAQKQDSLQQTQRTLSIDEVVVTGSRIATDRRLLPMTISVVEREHIEQDNRPSLLPTLVEQVPGLFITSRGVMGYGVASGAAGGISVRGVGGSPTTGVMVLIDGHPQYMGLMGHPIADAYQSMIADRVEVVRGPASVLYGSNAMGGVINIITRKSKEPGSHTDIRLGYGSYNTLEAEAANRTHAGRFSSTVTASYSRSDGHRANMDYEQAGGYARLAYDLGREWEITGEVNLTHFNASNPGSISSPIIDNDSRITRGTSSIALRNSRGAVSAFYNWGVHRINDGYSAGDSPLDYRFRSQDAIAGAMLYQSFTLLKGNRTMVGADYRHFGGKALNRYLDGSADKIIADKEMDNVAAYIDLQQQLTPWLTLDAGVRMDYNSHIGTEWVPQGGLAVQLPRNMQLKAMVSKGFRFPTIREMYMFPPQNPDLKAERMWNYEISLRQQVGRIAYGVSLFYIDGENMIRTLPVDGRMMNVNTGRVENFGTEIEATWSVSSHLSLSANYSYLHTKYPVVAAPEHKLYAGARYAVGRWALATDVQLLRGLITQISPLTEENVLLWNCDLGFTLARQCRLYLRAENILAQRYEINAGYPMPRATLHGGVKLSF